MDRHGLILAMTKIKGVQMPDDEVGKIKPTDLPPGDEKFLQSDAERAAEQAQKVTYADLHERYKRYFENDDSDWSALRKDSKYLVDSSENHEPYNRIYSFLEEEVFSDDDKIIGQYFKGERIIDLGCGKSARIIADYAMRHGSSEYIGVDKYHNNSDVNMDGRRKNLPKIAVIDDMLIFLRNETDNSSSLVINGLDQFIFNMSNPDTREYIELVLNEIERIVGEDHSVIGYESRPIFKGLEARGYKAGQLGSSKILEKIQVFHKSV